jgi:MFS superfamily sulfate permease-like transporter
MFSNISTNHLKSDFSAGLVVFLVALPLCMGIALASGAPLFSGIIAGITGGIVTGYLSNSHVSVSGPAAGLSAIVLSSILELNSFNVFLLAVLLAGVFQFLLGIFKAGTISNYFPNNVIEGMLGGIGIIILLKQIPHALGFDRDAEGDFTFIEKSGENTLSSIVSAVQNIHPGAVIISVISLGILIGWERHSISKKVKYIPGALIAVVTGILLNIAFNNFAPALAIGSNHMVNLPIISRFSDLADIIIVPDWAAIIDTRVWLVAMTLTIVGSIETLLCIEAGDRMDFQKRYTNTNKELKAQGIGNIINGLIGGLPITSVVVRTSANINAGAKTKLATIIHGCLLLLSALFIPFLLNKIPLSTLAAILLVIGYKLANPDKLKIYWKRGKYQFAPYIITLLAVVFTDLLKGVCLGMVVSFIFILIGNAKRAYYLRKDIINDGDIIHIDLAQEVSFLNKAAIKLTLNHLPHNTKVIINASNTEYIAYDVLELIKEFNAYGAKDKNIDLVLVGFDRKHNIENTTSDHHNIWVEPNSDNQMILTSK